LSLNAMGTKRCRMFVSVLFHILVCLQAFYLAVCCLLKDTTAFILSPMSSSPSYLHLAQCKCRYSFPVSISPLPSDSPLFTATSSPQHYSGVFLLLLRSRSRIAANPVYLVSLTWSYMSQITHLERRVGRAVCPWGDCALVLPTYSIALYLACSHVCCV
jgi:hypothetical protein